MSHGNHYFSLHGNNRQGWGLTIYREILSDRAGSEGQYDSIQPAPGWQKRVTFKTLEEALAHVKELSQNE